MQAREVLMVPICSVLGNLGWAFGRNYAIQKKKKDLQREQNHDLAMFPHHPWRSSLQTGLSQRVPMEEASQQGKEHSLWMRQRPAPEAWALDWTAPEAALPWVWCGEGGLPWEAVQTNPSNRSPGRRLKGHTQTPRQQWCPSNVGSEAKFRIMVKMKGVLFC